MLKFVCSNQDFWRKFGKQLSGRTLLALVTFAAAPDGIVGQTLPNEETSVVNELIVAAPAPAPSAEIAPSADATGHEPDERADAPLLRRRIVDRETIEKERSSIARLLLAPFRRLAPIVNRRLTELENERELDRLAVLFNNPFFQPLIGGLGEGSGFGAGGRVSTADRLSPNFKFFASGHATLRGYAEAIGGVEIAPRRWANRKVQFQATGRYSIRPEEDFFGTGANSFRSNRTSYFRRERAARFDARWQAFPKITFGAFTDFSQNTITDGKDRRGARITKLFNQAAAPGLERGVRLLDAGIYAEYEGRDEPENPHRGAFVRATVSRTEGIGAKNDFGSFNYDFDARAYLPLGSRRRVLAARFLGNFKDARGGAAGVPLFRLARLGDAETLRGYESYRYQGLNAVHLSVEYRFALMQGSERAAFRGVEAVFFGDFGQVFNRRNELAVNNVKATWGGGLQFLSRKRVMFAALYARSPESSRLILRFGKTF